MIGLGRIAATLGAALLLAACGQGDDGNPTAAENQQLNQIADELDTSADSLVADPELGNGESAETGDVLVAEEGNGSAAANVQ
ncbi:MAG TPA: hypothetical protein VGB59_06565 [Allosphingosinicella sp.]|jgi:hypothetical protein